MQTELLNELQETNRCPRLLRSLTATDQPACLAKAQGAPLLPVFTKTKIALSAAIALSGAFSASAATKHRVSHVHRTATHYMVRGYNPQRHLDSDDPALTGGGSLGYNKNIYNW